MAQDLTKCPACNEPLDLLGQCAQCAQTENLSAQQLAAMTAAAGPAKQAGIGGISFLPSVNVPRPQRPRGDDGPMELTSKDKGRATFHEVDGNRLELDESRRARPAGRAPGPAAPSPSPSNPAAPKPAQKKGLLARWFGK